MALYDPNFAGYRWDSLDTDRDLQILELTWYCGEKNGTGSSQKITHKTLAKWPQAKYGHHTRRKYIEEPNYRILNSIDALSKDEETIIRRDRAPIDEIEANNCDFELERRMPKIFHGTYAVAVVRVYYI